MNATWEIVRTDAKQPWHAREVGGNGEKTWTTEQYARKVGAERALCRLAERWGWENVVLIWDAPTWGNLEDSKRGTIVGAVRMVDERTP